MGTLTVEQPEKLGLSSERLARINRFFADHYVDTGKLPGMLTLVARRGQVASLDVCGHRDVENAQPLTDDTIFRIYSMTKPIVSVALMQLYEQGAFRLDDPVSRFIPSFADLRVWRDGTPFKFRTNPATREMTIRDLLTHTSGLTYGFTANHPVDALYRARGVERLNVLMPAEGTPSETVAEMVDKLAELPLLFSPGTRWSYSVATDVCGRLVEIMSGRSLDAVLREQIFEPLGMVDSGFSVPADKVNRLASCYSHTPRDPMLRTDPASTSTYLSHPAYLSGGGGLVATAADYLRFCTMLLNKGELDGHRILGRKTVEYMTVNHLPGNVDLAAMGQPTFGETTFDGIGFGLGFSVVLDPAQAQVIGSPGIYAWGGAASTTFWVDPREELIVIGMTQLLPSSTYPMRKELQALVYQALID
jgi:CubicO group peptidase (beta-lactamase class C family)